MPSVRELLDEGSAVVGRSDARILACHALKCSPASLAAHPGKAVPEEKAALFRRYVDEAASGRPLPYITGRQCFWQHEFIVSEAVLIPRPDTETLVEEALAAARKFPAARILDLGTGSGCIAISLARELPHSSVTAVDASREALAVAESNRRALSAGNVFLLEGDWYGALQPGCVFDVIVSNPPYIREGDPHLEGLAAEPEAALVSGTSGLDDLEKIVRGAPAHLSRGGWLLVEHGYDQGSDARGLFSEAGLIDAKTARDLGGNERVTMGRLP